MATPEVKNQGIDGFRPIIPDLLFPMGIGEGLTDDERWEGCKSALIRIAIAAATVFAIYIDFPTPVALLIGAVCSFPSIMIVYGGCAIYMGVTLLVTEVAKKTLLTYVIATWWLYSGHTALSRHDFAPIGLLDTEFSAMGKFSYGK